MKDVLVVDDDKDILEIHADILEFEGFRVETASNGKEAINKLDGQRFDLVLTDYNMPILNGAKLLKFINSNYPSLPVIIISGRQHIPEIGPTHKALVQKPISAKQLVLLCELFT